MIALWPLGYDEEMGTRTERLSTICNLHDFPLIFICQVLYAAAWICGEFAELVRDPKIVIESMLRPKITTLPGHIQGKRDWFDRLRDIESMLRPKITTLPGHIQGKGNLS